MKKLIIALIAMTIAGVASAILVDDFTGDTRTHDISVQQIELGWRDGDGTASASTIATTGGAGDNGSFARLVTGYRSGRSGGQWYSVSALGLVAGTDYKLIFDYMVGEVGTRETAQPADANSMSMFVFGNNGAANYASRIEGETSDTLYAAQTSVQRFTEAGPNVADVMGWATKTSTGTFQIAAADTMVFIGFGYAGFGSNVINPPADNYDYLGLDNINIVAVPEPATVGMLGLGALVALLIRRVRG